MPYLIALIVLGVLLLMYAFAVEPGLLTVRRYAVRFASAKKRLQISRNEKTNGLHVVFFSDLHVGPYFRGKRLDRFCRRIENLNPDLILCGGDLVTEQSDVKSDAFRAELTACFRRLCNVAPVVAVYGNHDVEAAENGELSRAVYAEAGVTLLTNTIYTHEGRENQISTHSALTVYGCEEGFYGQPNPVPDGFAGLFLCHQPDLVPELLQTAGPVLALSGHTHRGQVTLAGLPLVKVPLGRTYTYGLYVFNEAQALLVSGGVGTVHLPLRFGARPELLSLHVDIGE